jgi:2-oxoglutarate ferredoxin oxidoreductase subunit alpha
MLRAQGVHVDGLRLRAYPFPESVKDFILSHEQVFVVEQNRDAQMQSLLVNEFEIDPAHLVKVLHYDGTPITARFIVDAMLKRLGAAAQPNRQMAKESA